MALTVKKFIMRITVSKLIKSWYLPAFFVCFQLLMLENITYEVRGEFHKKLTIHVFLQNRKSLIKP